MQLRWIFTLAFSALLAVSASAVAQESNPREVLLEPLPIRDQFLLANGFYSFEPEGPHVLDGGATLFELHCADANTFAKSGWISRSLEGDDSRADAAEALSTPRYMTAERIFLADGQTHRATLSWKRGLGAHLQVGVAVPVSTIGGGWSDAIIEGVHHELRVGNAERDALRKNRETVYLRTDNTTYLRERSGGAQLGDVAITAKYELSPLEDDHVALALLGAVELPTGDARTLDGSGSLDAGLQLLASRDFGRTRIHAALGLLRLGADAPLGTPAQITIANTVGLSRLVTEHTSATAQLTVAESPLRSSGIPEFTRRSYQLAVGVQHAFARTVVYAGMIENLFTYDNSADAGLQWGIRRQF